jgi:beta-mannosidase
VLESEARAVEVPARSALRVPLPSAIATPSAAGSELLLADLGPDRATWFFADYRHSALPSPEFDLDAERADDGWRVRVTAGTLIRDLTLLVDRVHPDAVVDGGLVTLLPGETATFAVRGAESASAADFGPAIRSANDLVAARPVPAGELADARG